VRVRETVPETFVDRANEVIHVEVTVRHCGTGCRGADRSAGESRAGADDLLSQWQSLDAPRIARRGVADEVGEKAASCREREGLEPALMLERVMVCMSSNALAPRVIRTGARVAGRLGSKWYAVYVETPREKPDRINPRDSEALQHNIRLAESLGATVVRVKAARAAEGLIALAQREGVTHVVLGQSARTRFELLWRESTLEEFLSAIPDATVHVVPLNEISP
jgi:two-component system, OmpR family, sensor histidine kinase KdpD